MISPGASGGGSDKNDGTNSTIHLEADVIQGTGVNTVQSVQFAYDDLTKGTGDINIGSPVSGPPYSLEWTPPGTIDNGDSVKIVAQALHGVSPVASDDGPTFTLDNTFSTVHITTPSDNGAIGEYNGNVEVHGTRSADDPAVTVKTGTDDVANDTIAFGADGTTGIVPGTGNDQKWFANVPVQNPGGVPTDNTTTARVIRATATGTGESDETIDANVYHAVLNGSSLTVTQDTSQAALPPSGTGEGTFTITVDDQRGNPITGLDVITNATTDAGGAPAGTLAATKGDTADAPGGGECGVADTATSHTLCALTDENGQVVITDTRGTAGTDTLTFETDYNNDGSYNSAVDDKTTKQFTTYLATPQSMTLGVLPNQTTFGDPEYGNVPAGDDIVYTDPTDPSTAVENDNGNGPLVRVLIKDQQGNPLAHTTIPNFTYSVKRTVTSDDPDTVTGGQPVACSGGEDIVGGCTTDKFGYIYLPHDAAPSNTAVGTDVFNAWKESGSQGEDPNDQPQAAPLTLTFSNQQIFFDPCGPDPQAGFCRVQQRTNTTTTYTVHDNVGGNPVVGRRIDFDTGGNPIIATTQPAGTVRDSDTHAHCNTTDAQGTCRINLTDVNQESAAVFATDAQTGAEAELVVEYRNNALGVVFSDEETTSLITPLGTSSGGGSDETYVGRPGDVIDAKYRLSDASCQNSCDNPNTGPLTPGDGRLTNVSGTATIDHGFFVARPTAADGDHTTNYRDLQFDTTPTAGAMITNPHSLGQSIQFQTNNWGNVHFPIAIGRDAGFDDDGQVQVHIHITVTGLGAGALDLSNPANEGSESDNIGPGHIFNDCFYDFFNPASDDFSDCNVDTTWSTDTFVLDEQEDDPANGLPYYNPGTITLQEANGDPLSGNIPTAQRRTVNFFVTDSFGNLTRTNEEIEVDSAGVGELETNDFGDNNQVFADGSYKGQNQQEPVFFENDEPSTQGDCDDCYDPTNPWGTAGHQDVNFFWNEHKTVYQTDPNDATQLIIVVDPPARDCTGYCTFFEGLAEVPPVTGSVASLDWYLQVIRTQDGAHYTITHIPSGNVFRVGTTVTETLLADDQHDQPIPNLNVDFLGAGPGAENCINGLCLQSTTDNNGTASFSFTGDATGNTHVTGVVREPGTNNELARVPDVVGFDGAPSIFAPKSRTGAGRVHVRGTTRPGATVRLFHKPFGFKHFTLLATQTAGPDGSYSFNPRISRGNTFVVGVDRVAASKKVSTAVKDRAHITGSSPSKGRLHMRVTTSPQLHGVRVNFFRVFGDGSTHLLGHAPTNGSGVATLTVDATSGGHWVVRGHVAGAHGVAGNKTNKDHVDIK